MHDLVFNKLSETQLSITCTYGDHFFVRSEGFPYTFTVDLETTKKNAPSFIDSMLLHFVAISNSTGDSIPLSACLRFV